MSVSSVEDGYDRAMMVPKETNIYEALVMYQA